MHCIFLQEFPFLTIVKLPLGFVVHIGGIVSSKSVKLLDEISSVGNFLTQLLSYLSKCSLIFFKLLELIFVLHHKAWFTL